MSCPYLKEVRMVFCRASPVKKLVPLSELVSGSSCETDCAFQGCPAFQEARARVEQAALEGQLVDELVDELTPTDPEPEKGRTP
ncbi:MAG TPA: hypothetical protein VEB43_09745 [Anaeromyxobacter sp.]|nr:hypothetical protein [Anaeromyxobacter sp.]